MIAQDLTLLLILILVHLVADFFMQTPSGVAEKAGLRYRSKFLYLHSAIHGTLSFIVLWIALDNIPSILGMTALITLTHLIIDLGKSYTPEGRSSWYVLDQILHHSVIVFVWVYLTEQWALAEATAQWLLSPKPLIILIAYILTTRPIAFLIALAIGNWEREIDNSGSLAKAGARIGKLERFLILTFVLTDHFTAIGFLLVAKAILRFGDLREAHDRRLTDYVLVGTLISFTTTIILGLVTQKILSTL